MILIKTLKNYLAFRIKKLLKKHKLKIAFKETVKITKELELNGYCIIKNYWPKEQCIQAISQIEDILKKYPDYVQAPDNSDFRIFGVEVVSETLSRFSDDPLLLEVANLYNQEKSAVAFTLGAKLAYSPGNMGSGGGWHRDAFYRQFKAIIYLTDTNNDAGPFQLIRSSQQLGQLLADIFKGNFKFNQYRFSEQQVANICAPQHSRLATLVGSAGDLILVDTSCIHRGMPIKAGLRYALTNYYFPETRINSELYQQFSPVMLRKNLSR